MFPDWWRRFFSRISAMTRGVVATVCDNSDRRVVLGRRAHQGRSSDVDILDRVFKAAVGPCHRCRKRIEIDHDQVDRGNGLRVHHGVVLSASAENATVHFRVQRLDPAVHHFRKAGVIRDLCDCQAGFAEQSVGAASG